MSSGQFVRSDGFNKTIMRDGLILTLRKDGTVKVQRDPKTGDIGKGSTCTKHFGIRRTLKKLLKN